MSEWTYYRGTLRTGSGPNRDMEKPFYKRLEEFGVVDPCERGILGDTWTFLNIMALLHNRDTIGPPSFPFDAGAGSSYSPVYNIPYKPGTLSCAPIPPIPSGSEGICGELVHVSWVPTHGPMFILNISLRCRDRGSDGFINLIQLWLDTLWAWTAFSGELTVDCRWFSEEKTVRLRTPDLRYWSEEDCTLDEDQIAAYIIKMWCDIQVANARSEGKEKYDFEYWWYHNRQGIKYDVDKLDEYVATTCQIKYEDEEEND